MPLRVTPLVTNEIYHVVNRGVNHQPIFGDRYDYRRAGKTIAYYQFAKPPIRFSFLNRLSQEELGAMLKELKEKGQNLVTLIAYCLMPNHLHLLMRQEEDNGISKFMSKVQNSYTRYYNSRHERDGHLFKGQFKAIRIETEEQLVHTSRYIHLNPFTSYVVNSTEQLKNYEWSSLSQYIHEDKNGFCKPEAVLSRFKSPKKYLQFIFDQKDYQRELSGIKHLALE